MCWRSCFRRSRAVAGIYDCGRTVVNEEGVRALWKGLTPFATHLTLKYALRMGSNSVYQVRVTGRQQLAVKQCDSAAAVTLQVLLPASLASPQAVTSPAAPDSPHAVVRAAAACAP
jgi:hypothetical protein